MTSVRASAYVLKVKRAMSRSIGLEEQVVPFERGAGALDGQRIRAGLEGACVEHDLSVPEVAVAAKADDRIARIPGGEGPDLRAVDEHRQAAAFVRGQIGRAHV